MANEQESNIIKDQPLSQGSQPLDSPTPTEEPISSNKRIAKNTIFLYFRMLITMAVGLYTSRVVLNTLGVESYGVYSVVGGVIALFSFINMTISSSTQRFLNYYKKSNNDDLMIKIFSNSINNHFVIASIVVILLETFGLWFIYNKAVIPCTQFDAAVMVFHISVIDCFINILFTPYTASIIASEKFKIYAHFSIIETLLKLLIVYLLTTIPGDKLIIYSILLLCVTVFTKIIYLRFSYKTISYCKYKFSCDLNLLKEMFNYSFWMIFGCFSTVLCNYGITILINLFWGPIYNASKAIAGSVQAIVNSFGENLIVTAKPQIISCYANNKIDEMYDVIIFSSKFSFYILFILILPLMINSQYILDLWLVDVPPLCSVFMQLILIDVLIRILFEPIGTLNQASGKIFIYQVTISLLWLFQFITTYVVYSKGFNPATPFIIAIIISVVGYCMRLLILHKVNNFNVILYLKKVLCPILVVTVLSFPIPIIYAILFKSSIVSLVLSIIICLITTTINIFAIGLTKQERIVTINYVRKLLNKAKK